MNKITFTVTGYHFYDGMKPFEDTKYFKLIKEEDNEYDSEAIRIEDFSGKKLAYVANSYNTIIKGTMSAGRIYDKIGNIGYCKVYEINSYGIICEVIDKDKVRKKSPNKVMRKVKNKFFKIR
ncbi:hypothetical protein MBCUT_20910 [Methanobrevibacter cuticularis]|uniref:HIRAN domain-containing protein n=1 Tax=Methanobrevibacter cuticularis TaxID=47311 RepID=A0A166CHN4_9EURY|nr:HIRAN domain-containing protein [Methanobrevibacter cuticularis]KZX14519.1 hypothetical protein MBCUT_20910 [Methanobrevibacter cuticularis]